MKNTFCVLSSLLFFISTINAQCVSGDCVNGRGIYMYTSGAKYVGDFQNGEIHGIGTCYYTDGSKYQGEWVMRYPEGNGTKTLSDGTKIKGLWLKGQAVNARGQLINTEIDGDGTDIQAGCLQGNCKNGEGIFAYANGSKYEGQFLNGMIDGWGTWYYPNGDKYIGSFKNNHPNGTGNLYEASGNITSGEWSKGEYMGDLRAKHGELGCIRGNCENGQGTYVFQDAVAKFTGSFQAGRAHGKGICEYANGDRYEGEWANGQFNGFGTLIFKDGRRAEGQWQNGKFIKKTLTAQQTKPATTRPTTTSPQPTTQATVTKDLKVWAIVIGVGAYNHMPPLKYTDDDAYRMYAFLKSPEGGALSDDQIRILIDEDATKAKILSHMDELYSQAGPNDLIMLYFSGHGLKGSFLPIDFDGFNNKLLHDEINQKLKNSPAKYKLCIADACHSGSLLAMRSGTAVESTLSNYYKTLAQSEAGTALIMSSKSEENSLESSGLRQGVFSHFLIRGLKGEADNNGNKVVSVQELFDFIYSNVKSYTGNQQSPVIKGDYDENMTIGVIR